MDPFHAFASYPTALLTPQTVLGLVNADVQTAVRRVADYRQLAMVNFAKVVLPTEAEVQAIPAERQAFAFRALEWLVKLGVLRVVV